MPTIYAPYTYIPLPSADRSVFGAKVYFGRPDTDPVQSDNRIQVRKVETGRTFVNVDQPLVAGPGGVILVDGAPAHLNVAEERYSVVITDENDNQLYSFTNSELGGVIGRSALMEAGGLPFDNTIEFDETTLVINPALHTNALILVDASAGNVSISLPAVSGIGVKFRFTVKKIDNSDNTVTIDPEGADTIDGATTLVIEGQWEAVEIVASPDNRWSAGSGYLFNLGPRLRAVEVRSLKSERQVRNIFQNITLITASDATWNPPRNGRAKRIIACGPGGHGDTGGGGGGAGVAITNNFELRTTESYAIVISAGGSETATTISGDNSQTPPVNIDMTANGGTNADGNTAGMGGTATDGDLNLTGGNGGTGSQGHGGGGSIGGFDPNATPAFENNGYNGGADVDAATAHGGGAGTGGAGGNPGGNFGGGGGGSHGAGGLGGFVQYGGVGAPFPMLSDLLPVLNGRGGRGGNTGFTGRDGADGGPGGGGGGAGTVNGTTFALGGSGGFGAGGGGGDLRGGNGGLGAGGGGGSTNVGGNGGDGFIMIIWDETE